MNIIALAVLFLAVLPLAAQAPDAPEAEPPIPSAETPELEPFAPRAGYVNTVEQLARERALSESPLDGAPAEPVVLSGKRDIPVIAIAFKNIAGPYPATDYERLLFSDPAVQPPRKTLSQYYSDMSAGRFTAAGRVVGWYTLPQNDTYYENNEDTNDDGVPDRLRNGAGVPFGEMLTAAFERADEELNFAQFDNDGPDSRPNSVDDDGIVDLVFIIHPEAGAECKGVNPGDRTNIWSKFSRYSRKEYGTGKPYATKDLSAHKKNPDGTPKPILIEDFTIQPALACTKPAEPRRMIDVGVFCHEYGHALGIPDLYDRTTEPVPSSGLGNHCLMSRGNYGWDNKSSATPLPISAWPLYRLGWADVRRISANGNLEFSPADPQSPRIIYRFDVPKSDVEYFLIEYRQREQPAGGAINWNERLPTSGLAIWHVDENVGSAEKTWPFTNFNKGQNDSPSRPTKNAPHTFPADHALVALVQADGELHLENNRPADAGDFWTSGAEFRDDPTLKKGPRAYNGSATGLKLTGIDLQAMQIAAVINDFPEAATAGMQVSSMNTISTTSTGSTIAGAAAAVEAVEANVPVMAETVATPALKENIAYSAPVEAPTLPMVMAEEENLNRGANAASDPEALQRALEKLRKLGLFSTQSDTGFVANGARLIRGDRIEEADALFDQNLKSVIGDVDLADLEKDNGSEALYYEQMIDVAGERLPLIDKEVVFRFNKNYLRSVSSTAVDPASLVVTGDPDGLEAEEAIALVQRGLRVARARIQSAREAVFLPDDDSAKGRVVYEVLISAGEEREPLRVIVDQETKKVLAIR